VIPFATWLDQMIRYCRFVADDAALRRAWIGGDFSSTSLTDFDELFEQVFDDLDSDGVERELDQHLPDDDAGKEALGQFLQALRAADEQRRHDIRLLQPSELLSSIPWQGVVRAGQIVLEVFGRG